MHCSMALSRSGPEEEKDFTTKNNPAYVGQRRDAQDPDDYEMVTVQPPPVQEGAHERDV